jgi:uncharacterized protein YbaP (TraB family)
MKRDSALGTRGSWLVARCSAAAVALALVAQVQAAAPRNFLWKATSKSGGALYLVGSVHLLSQDSYPLSPALETAFKDSDLLVEEADLGEMGANAQLTFLSRGMLPSSTPLDKVLSAATYALLTKHVESLGIPLEPLKLLKPWMLAQMLEVMQWQKAGFDPELGLDKHFYDQAQSAGMKVQGLETIEFQVSLFDSMTMPEQDHLLAETLKEIDTEQSNRSKLMEAWKAGDAPTVEGIVLAALKQDPNLYRRLLVDRNKSWIPQLEALFARKGHAFVVVGAAHLVGPDGLIAMLRAKGYTVQQM